MAAHDDQNNPRVNFVPHPVSTDEERGIPYVGKIVSRLDSPGTLEVCTALTPDPDDAGGGTWVSVGGGGGCATCLESPASGDPTIQIESTGDIYLETVGSFDQFVGNDVNLQTGRDVNINTDRDLNVGTDGDFNVGTVGDFNVTSAQEVFIEGDRNVEIRSNDGYYVQIGGRANTDVRIMPTFTSGSTLGSLLGAWPIYDRFGAVVGYVPVYSSIS